MIYAWWVETEAMMDMLRVRGQILEPHFPKIGWEAFTATAGFVLPSASLLYYSHEVTNPFCQDRKEVWR